MDEPKKKKRKRRDDRKPRKNRHKFATDKARENLLAKARVAVTNSTTYPEIKTEILRWGVDEVLFKEGFKLHKKADLSIDTQAEKRDELIAATGELNRKIKEGRKMYIDHLNLARIAIGNRIKFQMALGLKGKRHAQLGRWLDQARLFYQNALDTPEILKLLRIVGLTREKLLAGINMMAGIDEAEDFRAQKKGESIQATIDRDDVFEELSIWLSAFYLVCKMVFHSGPDRQILERLGIPAITSPKRKKKKNKPKPVEEPEEEPGKEPVETGDDFDED
ncbi:MAG: hypothetical protein GY940_14560 [bacterium]|nr:hypothetical protein [bacterium]